MKKPNKPQPFTSLAIRVLLIVLLVMVIPLILQSFFLYREEYKNRLKEVQADLKVIAHERVHLIEEIIHRDWQLLDSWPEDQHITERGGLVQRIPLPSGVSEHFFVISLSEQALLVGKMEYDYTALVIPLPFKIIVSDMTRTFPIQASLIGDEGRVLWESAEILQSDKVIEVQEDILSTNLCLRLSVNEQDIRGLHLESYYLRFASLLFFVGIIGGAMVYFFIRRIEKPLKNLCRTMERVSEGAAHARYTPDWMGFEINSLGKQFNATLDGLLASMELAEKERIGRETLASELKIGHEIQENLLNASIPTLKNIDIAAQYLSSLEVNGDFYEIIRLENGNLLIAICDTAGKGISACLFSLGLRSIIRTLASVTNDLSEIVRKANDVYLTDSHESSMFSTLWIGIYDPVSRWLTYCSNGHPPAYLLRESEIQPLWTEGIALGAISIDVVAIEGIALEPQDTLVLYTDGILEAHDTEGNLFNKERLEEILLKEPIETAQKLSERVIKDVRVFSETVRQHDDITLLVMRIVE